MNRFSLETTEWSPRRIEIEMGVDLNEKNLYLTSEMLKATAVRCIEKCLKDAKSMAELPKVRKASVQANEATKTPQPIVSVLLAKL